MASRQVKYRTSPHLVAYWEQDRLILYQFASGQRAYIDVTVVQILETCRKWRTVNSIANLTGLSSSALRGAVAKLVRASFLQRSDRTASPRERAYDHWGEWNPAAGLFHSATRAAAWPLPPEREADEAQLRAKARSTPPPAPVTSQRGLKKFALPPPRRDGEFASVLLSRRTWRGFSRRPVPLRDLSTLLWFTAGVQRWGTTSAGERVPLKTSPSAGSKHPIELYVFARNVRGLRSGIYHYASDKHRLGLITPGVSARRLERYLGNQWQFREAGAVVVMVAVMARTRWTYPGARAYRSILAEAGHVCQTFCLVATWLNLAPFCTMALAESALERVLDIDGVERAALYAAGVGMKPDDGRWIQWPEHEPGKPYTPLKRGP